jgi:hypothetical protein
MSVYKYLPPGYVFTSLHGVTSQILRVFKSGGALHLIHLLLISVMCQLNVPAALSSEKVSPAGCGVAVMVLKTNKHS